MPEGFVQSNVNKMGQVPVLLLLQIPHIKFHFIAFNVDDFAVN